MGHHMARDRSPVTGSVRIVATCSLPRIRFAVCAVRRRLPSPRARAPISSDPKRAIGVVRVAGTLFLQEMTLVEGVAHRVLLLAARREGKEEPRAKAVVANVVNQVIGIAQAAMIFSSPGTANAANVARRSQKMKKVDRVIVHAATLAAADCRVRVGSERIAAFIMITVE